MPPTPSVAPFAELLTDLATDLRLGNCCLVTADKGWTHFLFQDLRERLRPAEIRWEYLDGRPEPGGAARDDVGIVLTALTHLRRAVRGEVERCVVALPHLDVLAPAEAGWTNVSRELVPLLYENPAVVFLGFQEPTLPLLPIVEKLFHKKYKISAAYRPPVNPLSSDSATPSAESERPG